MTSAFERWARNTPEVEKPALPAATVIMVRDGAPGLEVLIVRRSSKLEFAGGMWVFPGGRVDPQDHLADRPGDDLSAARRAGVREVAEEAGLVLAEEALVGFSHWTPPAGTPKRFSTWFFIAPAPDGAVTVDGGEIKAAAWTRPLDAIARRDAGEIELAPPTWITLHHLSGYRDVAEALSVSSSRQPEVFVTHIALTDGGVVALYDGDAGYHDCAVERPGPRHRLWMLDGGWRYERSC